MIFDIFENKLMRGGYTLGNEVFRSTIPADVSVGVMMRSSLTGFREDPNIRNLYRGAVQIVTRHSDPSLGEKMALQVAHLVQLNAARERYPQTQDRGAVTLLSFVAQSLPIEYPRLMGNGFEWSQTWDVVFTLKPMLT